MLREVKLPNLIIPGAAKSGTTLLADLLNLHPNIFVPNMKEPRYFVAEVLKNVNKKGSSFSSYNYLMSSSQLTIEDYMEFYNIQTAQTSEIIVDASVHYLYHYEVSIPAIKKTLDSPKILIVLRNPVYRSYSQYLYNHYLYLNYSFEEAFVKESYFKQKGFDFMFYLFSPSLYSDQVEAFLKAFSEVKIIIFEELISEPSRVMKEVFEFLELSPIAIKEIHKANETIVPVNRKLAKFLSSMKMVKKAVKVLFGDYYDKLKNLYRNKNFTSKKPRLENEVYHRIFMKYKEDIEKLEKLLGKDLKIWFNL